MNQMNSSGDCLSYEKILRDITKLTERVKKLNGKSKPCKGEENGKGRPQKAGN